MATPPTLSDPEVGLFMDGAWVDAVTVTSDGVRVSDPITVRRGRSNWASRPDPANATFTMDNRDGRWSPDNPTGAYFGNYKRNIPTRIGVGGAPTHLAFTGDDAGVNDTVATTPDTGVSGSRSTPTVTYTESATTTAGTSHTLNLPATVDEGDRLFAIIIVNGTDLSASTDLDSWSFLASGSIVGSFDYEIYTKVAIGDEDSGTLDWTTTGSRTMSGQIIRVTGASEQWEGAGFEFSVDTSDSFTLNPDPPAVTASWGAEATNVFIAGFFAGATGGTVTANPTSYTAGADGNASAGVWVGTAHRTNNIATEDPGTFTIDDGTSGENVRAFTIAVRGGFAAHGDIADLADLDLRVEYELDALEGNGFAGVLASTYRSGTGWILTIARDNNAPEDIRINLLWGAGTFSASAASNVGTGSGIAPAHLVSKRRAIRVTVDTDNGSGASVVRFYWSTSIAGTWTEIGTGHTQSQIFRIARDNQDLHVGSQVAGAGSSFDKPLRGRVYAVQLMTTIGGSTAEVDVDFEAQTIGDTSFTDDSSPARTWTIGTVGRITDRQWLFHGELASLPVRWDIQGVDIVAPVEASGIFRRLRQGRRLDSPMTRMAANGFFNVRHWPMEETGSPTQFAPALPVDYALFGDSIVRPVQVTTGRADGAAVDAFIASEPIPALGTSTMTVTAPTYTDVFGGFEVRFNLLITDPGPATNVEFLTVNADHTWAVEYRTDSGGQLRVVGSNGITVSSTWAGGSLDGVPIRVGLRVEESGSTVRGKLYGEDEDGNTVINVNSSFVTGTAGPVTDMTINTDQNFEGVGFGQLSLLYDYLGLEPTIAEELAGHAGERAAIRIMRLCDENNIEARIIGDPNVSRRLGPQRSGTLMDFIEEAADSDLGILFEPRETRAIGYRVRNDLHAQAPTIEVDYGNGELAKSPDPDRDDENIRNDVTVTNWNGSTGRAVLDDGSALSVSEPPDGLGAGYDESFRVTVDDDGSLDDLADIVLDRLTVDEPRISSLSLGMHMPEVTADAALSESFLDADLGDLIEIDNMLSSVFGVGSVVTQIIQGQQHVIEAVKHNITLNTGPASPYSASLTGSAGVTFRSVLSPEVQAPTVTPTLAEIEHPSGGTIYAGGSGTTHTVTTVAQWNTAVAAAAPGDIIKITASITSVLEYRGNKWGIGGTDADGTAGNPIVIACEGAGEINVTSITNAVAALSVYAVDHVWCVEVKTRGSAFGIYYRACEGTSAHPWRIAHCDVADTGDACITAAGWFQDINTYGGTAPNGYGGSATAGEWGFSRYGVIEGNLVDNPGRRVDHVGECVYLGYGGGGADSYKSYATEIWVRSNTLRDCKADFVDIKPGCSKIYVLDNDCEGGYTVDGAAMQVLYVFAALNARPSWYDFDPEIYIEGNRVRDLDITTTSGSSSNYFIQTSLCGVRCNNNIFWGGPNGAVGFRLRSERAASESQSSDGETWEVHNNVFWLDNGFVNVGAPAASPTAFSSSLYNTSNNIGPTGAAGVEFTASSSDFVDSAAIPTVDTVDADAEWETYGAGSAFDLDSGSSLVGTGTSMTALDLYLDQDISQRPIPSTSPNPGPFQVIP